MSRHKRKGAGVVFVAVRRISNKANETLAAVGQTCERVPAEALPGLERRGAIRRQVTPAQAHEVYDAVAVAAGHYGNGAGLRTAIEQAREIRDFVREINRGPEEE